MFGVLDEMGEKLPLLMDYRHKLDVDKTVLCVYF